MATNDDGLALMLIAAGELRAKAGHGSVTLATQTHYPFEEEVLITVRQSDAGEFPLYLRIPGWAAGATLRVNGAASGAVVPPRGYARIVRDWRAGDEIALRLPMKPRVRAWEKNKDSVSVDCGALTFSLRIEEKYRPVASDKTAQQDSAWLPGADASKWPSHEILPESPWNFGLVLNSSDPAAAFEVVRRPWPADSRPFTNAATPILLRARGRRLPDWKIDADGLAGVLPQSPVQSDEPLEDLTFVPMGGARLRISAIPVVKG